MPRLLMLLLTLLALGATAAPAGAVLPGEAGRIVFTSGRDLGDTFARLHQIDIAGLDAGVLPAFTTLTTEQHKHPSWSPDRTKIAYARGTPNANPVNDDFEIYVHDLVTGQITPLTSDDTQTSDRPAWSPDGTKIAYEEEVGNNDGSRDIWVEDVATGSRFNLTSDVAAAAFKAAWTPDGSQILFTTGSPAVANSMDVVKRNADGTGQVDGVLTDQNVSEFQHAISPDGRQLCWSEGTGFNNSAELWTGPINVPQQNKVNLSDDKDLGDFNCVWSPEGDEILYVKGAFEKAKLVLAPWPDTDIEREITDDPTTPTPNKFDGNPDWATDGRPVCPDVTVQTTPGTPVVIPTECTDTGPAYEHTPVREGLTGADPEHGTATDPLKDDSNTSTYTPEPGFVGTDTYSYRGIDDAGFSDGAATITVNVVVPRQPTGPAGGPGAGPAGVGSGQTPPPPPPPAVLCGGKIATIVGTAGADTIRGTSGRDVIAARGGNDTVSAVGGNDLVCGGDGNDTANGGRGNDRLLGERGNDRLRGGPGRDRLGGGSGRDRLFGEVGRDNLVGGAGVDLLRGGPGRDVQRQ